IRRWILENDWLEAIIALPEELFYNTGIATYIWVLSNRKAPHRRGKVQLIDATSFYAQMRKGLGSKRHEISDADIERIRSLYKQFDLADPNVSKVLDTIDLGYRKITVDRPRRLNFQVKPERLERLQEETGFKGLAISKKRDPDEKVKEETAGRTEQARLIAALQTISDKLYKNRPEFEAALNAAMKQHGIKLAAPVRKSIMNALSERDETAEICYDKDGRKEPDNELRDYEYIPLEYEF